MQLRYFLAASAASLTLATALATPAMAQQVTSGIEGTVTDESGATVAGATVRIDDTRTGTGRTLMTDANGLFRTDGLITGGPYTITATAPGYEGQTVENVSLNLQGNTQLTFALSASNSGDTIVVTGQRARLTQLAIGPGQSFGAEELEAFPSISRDFRDIIRIDPRVSLDRTDENDRISCLGGNDRSNTFTVDGIAQSDVYGLNYTPFGARNAQPIPYDAVRETSVEFAPFDVQYGQFTGCAINVVTKSGQNDFHGSAFFTYASDKLRGDKAGGTDFSASPFKEYRWGATISGPIIKDRLFFFGAYEETNLADSQDDGPVGAGYANDLDFVTQAQFDQFSDTLKNVYGYDTGGLARSLPESSRRFFGRADWYITDGQRLEATYQNLRETNIEPDDFSTSSRVLTGFNSFEDEGTESNHYSLRLYSDWTDNFSTEMRVSRAVVQDIQGPVGGGEAQSDNPMPRFVVGVTNGGRDGSIVAGPGFSRASNDLKTTINQAKFLGRLKQDSHTLMLGVEVNQLKVFNLFAQNTTGTLTFANLTDFQNGLLSGGTNTFPNGTNIVNGDAAGAYGNFTGSGDINDAAANWKRTIYSIYGQDEWQATDRLNILAGVRVDWLDGDAPVQNPNFVARYGFSNRIPFSRIDPVILPRIGFTYNVENQGFFSNTQVKGGVGIFTGGDPTVYYSNSFQNNGYGVGQGNTGTAACGPAGTQIDVTPGGTFTGIPQCIVTAGAASSAAGTADTQSIDPDFKTPTVLRANIGLATTFGTATGFFSDWHLNLDYIYSRVRNPIDFVDLSQVVDTRLGANGYTLDGRPIYRAIDPTRTGCNAVLQDMGGSPPTYTGVTSACFGTSRDDEIQLTNGRNYTSQSASAILTKRWDRGLFTEGGAINFNLGYAYTDAKNNRYNNSSTATSSFDIVASFDRQNSAVATAEFQTRHNISMGLNFKEKFFGDNNTSFGFVFVARSGRPYSIVQDNVTSSVFNDSASGDFNSLLYIPTGINDPNVVYANGRNPDGSVQSGADAAAALDSYINANKCIAKYRGQSIPRNTCNNPWFYDLDLRFSQELLGPGRLLGLEDKIKLFVDFDNFLNLLDSDSNVFKRYRYTEAPIQANFNGAGQYVYSSYSDNTPQIQPSSSLWKIQLGVSYEF